MDTSEYGQFTCEFCGKPYPWQPQFAGKKVRCECGEVMIAPDRPPASRKQSNGDFEEYDLADEPAPANKPGAPLANSPTPTKLAPHGDDAHPLPPAPVAAKPRAAAHVTPDATGPTLAYQSAPIRARIQTPGRISPTRSAANPGGRSIFPALWCCWACC